MRALFIGLSVCTAIALAVPAGTQAQGVGGVLKKKVSELTGKDERKNAPDPSSTVYSEDVLELTEPVMKGFMNGVRVELTLLDEFARLMDTYKRHEEYARCGQEAAMSPEGMEIAGRLASLPDNATADEVQRAMEKMGQEMLALRKKKCGPDANEDWPQAKRRERVEAIVAKAAAAAGAVDTPSPSPQPFHGPAIGDAMDPGLFQQAGMTLRQYGITWERAENYCRLLQSGAIHPLQPVVHPAPGGKVFWIYSEVEARAIEPLCEEIIKAAEDRNLMSLYIYWELTGTYGR